MKKIVYRVIYDKLETFDIVKREEGFNFLKNKISLKDIVISDPGMVDFYLTAKDAWLAYQDYQISLLRELNNDRHELDQKIDKVMRKLTTARSNLNECTPN